MEILNDQQAPPDRNALILQITQLKESIEGILCCDVTHFLVLISLFEALLRKLQDVRAQNLDLTTENQILAEYVRHVRIRAAILG